MLSNAFQKNNLSINKFANLKLHTTQSNSLNAFYNIILLKYFYSGNALVDQMPKIGVLNGQRDRPTEFDGRTCTIAAKGRHLADKGRHLADIYCHDTNMLS